MRVRHYIGVLFTFILCQNLAKAQTSSLFHGGAHAESLAHTNTTFQGISGIYGNIAGLSYLDGFAGDVSYDGRFNLTELATASVSAAYGTKLGTIGFLASKYGFDSYSEHKIGLAYARKLGKGLSLGGMLDLQQFNTETNGTANKITFEIGLYAELTKSLHVGAHIYSPGTVSLTAIQNIPSRISLGVKYLVSEKATLSGEATKISERNIEIKMAVDYQLQNQLGLRFGSNITQSSIHAGLYIKVSEKLRITGAYSYNVNLGSTPSVSMSYGGFLEKEEKKDRRK